MKIQSIAVIIILLGVVLFSGYYLSQSEEVVEAAPVLAPVKAPLSVQATSIEQVEAQGIQPVVEQTGTYQNDVFNYRLSYPADWSKEQPSANVVVFQAPDHVTKVRVEAVGPIPADGLTAFVDRSLGEDVLISRQLLSLQNFPAERIIVFSDRAYVISGMGERATIEKIAHSFNAPQIVAQR